MGFAGQVAGQSCRLFEKRAAPRVVARHGACCPSHAFNYFTIMDREGVKENKPTLL